MSKIAFDLLRACEDAIEAINGNEDIHSLRDWLREVVAKAKKEIVDAWNRDNETGRAVTVRLDSGEIRKTVTRSSANLLGGHTPVIWLEGIAGCYALERVEPYDGVDDIPDADRAGGGALCPDCGKELYKHPRDLEHLGKGGVPFLTRLCSGRIVKL